MVWETEATPPSLRAQQRLGLPSALILVSPGGTAKRTLGTSPSPPATRVSGWARRREELPNTSRRFMVRTVATPFLPPGTPQSLESQLSLAVCGTPVPGSTMESESEDAQDPYCLRCVICV